jgi:dTDP-4-amino-4,6-dideoxygalactose transaminase
MASYRIPFNRPTMVGPEFEYIRESIELGKISGDGPFTKKCHALLEETLGVPKALLTTNCTHALEMTGLLLDLQPDDEVILPSYTFVSTANAYVLRGAKPVFCDIRPDTINLDEEKLEALITPKTKAIVLVHYGGIACEMNSIMEIANHHGIPVIEDNAHGLYGKYRGQNLGTIGVMATQSFHETKNFQCGEGGALLINDPQYIERAEIIREKGTNRSRFFRGQVDKYTWVDVGSSYLPSDILAAFLYAQLEARDTIQSKRQQLWESYHQALPDWADKNGVTLPTVPLECEQSYHMYYILLPSLDVRNALVQHLEERGILAVFHYLPLHLSEYGLRFGGKAGDCPVTEDISDRLLRLPFFNGMTEQDQTDVITALHEFSR